MAKKPPPSLWPSPSRPPPASPPASILRSGFDQRLIPCDACELLRNECKGGPICRRCRQTGANCVRRTRDAPNTPGYQQRLILPSPLRAGGASGLANEPFGGVYGGGDLRRIAQAELVEAKRRSSELQARIDLVEEEVRKTGSPGNYLLDFIALRVEKGRKTAAFAVAAKEITQTNSVVPGNDTRNTGGLGNYSKEELEGTLEVVRWTLEQQQRKKAHEEAAKAVRRSSGRKVKKTAKALAEESVNDCVTGLDIISSTKPPKKEKATTKSSPAKAQSKLIKAKPAVKPAEIKPAVLVPVIKPAVKLVQVIKSKPTAPFLKKSSGAVAKKQTTKPPRGTICITDLLQPDDMPALSLPKEAKFRRRSSIIQPPSASEQNGQKADNKDKQLERNIDKVVLGDLIFKSWYWSGYPKEIVGEKSLEGKGGIMVATLYVCKKCFKYWKVVEDWARHCRFCTKGVPGQMVYSCGVLSVWEVDGELEMLFCQNLSLFAKLFLDNKSVFFDVSSFNYFLLVRNKPDGDQDIIGFFSKEKMSWDCNNLACILVFPPYQQKGLGPVLIGVSYEISRREEILGGPEKPISDLGKKGYKKYWGSEIARWLLEVDESNAKKGTGLVTVQDISKATWIHPEDCLGVLREMGVVEKAAKGGAKGTIEAVRIDKTAVEAWVEKMHLDLRKVVDVDGFVEGYGYRKVVDEEVAG